MTAARDAERERFYQERDARTVDYLESGWDLRAAVSIEAGDDACSMPAGQVLLLTLVNQLMRFFRGRSRCVVESRSSPLGACHLRRS